MNGSCLLANSKDWECVELVGVCVVSIKLIFMVNLGNYKLDVQSYN